MKGYKNEKRQRFELKLERDLERWDQSIDVPEPSLKQMTNLIHEQNQKWMERLWKELCILWALAALILSFMAISYLYAPIIFVSVQVVVVLFLLLYMKRERLKVNIHESS